MSLRFWNKRAPKRSKPTPVPPVVLPTNNEPIVNSQYQPIRVTDERDGTVINRGYAYYSSSFVEPAGTILTFCGIVGKRPQWFRVELDGRITKLGALVAYDGEAEGWYLDDIGHLYLCDGPFLKRVNPFTGAETIVLDISATHPGCRLFQSHSDDAGLTHSATVERITSDGPYERLGTVVQCLSGRLFFSAIGKLDESQVTSDGSLVVIKEDDDNRIISLMNGSEYRIANRDGAFGHSDCGPWSIVGEDDQAGAIIWQHLLTRERRVLRSDVWNMGHVSVRSGRCLWSDATSLNLSLLALDGTGPTVLFHHGIDAAGDYDRQVRASLSPCGRVASYVANGSLYLLRLQ